MSSQGLWGGEDQKGVAVWHGADEDNNGYLRIASSWRTAKNNKPSLSSRKVVGGGSWAPTTETTTILQAVATPGQRRRHYQRVWRTWSYGKTAQTLDKKNVRHSSARARGHAYLSFSRAPTSEKWRSIKIVMSSRCQYYQVAQSSSDSRGPGLT